MKNLVLVLLIIFIFFTCAVMGYQLATHSADAPFSGQGGEAEHAGKVGEQHNLVFIQVDQLDSKRPHLKSLWYISLFYMERTPPTVTFAQIYPSQSQAPVAEKIHKSFALDANGEPSRGFWQAVQALDIKWEGYLLVDTLTMQRFLEWVNGPGNFYPLLDDPSTHAAASKPVIEQTCRLVFGLDNRKTEELVWGDLVPTHFRTDLRMDIALAYWKRVVASTVEARCEVVLAR